MNLLTQNRGLSPIYQKPWSVPYLPLQRGLSPPELRNRGLPLFLLLDYEVRKR